MRIEELLQNKEIGTKIYELITRLYPICRSITGNGVRKTLQIISEYIGLEIHEVPSGTKVFDWRIPKEWNINDAYVVDPNGCKIIDFKKSNLHVLNYSIPINKKIPFKELKNHLHTLADHPNAIPYLTTYYDENWGFCMSHNQYQKLNNNDNDEYNVVIDSSLTNGSLTYGEYFIKGREDDEILVSCYVCHPSLCNDNLSGVALSTFLAKSLTNLSDLNYSYRFLFIPETIGAITWIWKNEKNLHRIKHGFVATCLGDSGKITYKKTRNGDLEVDRTVIEVLKNSKKEYQILNFFPSGSDERQFCSPAFDLPVGSIMRTPYARFPEYHTSADNLEFVKKEKLADSYSIYISVISALEKKFITKIQNQKYVNLNPKCEPHLGNKGLYKKIGGVKSYDEKKLAILWILNLSDGNHTMSDISAKSNLSLELILEVTDMLETCGLIRKLKQS